MAASMKKKKVVALVMLFVMAGMLTVLFGMVQNNWFRPSKTPPPMPVGGGGGATTPQPPVPPATEVTQARPPVPLQPAPQEVAEPLDQAGPATAAITPAAPEPPQPGRVSERKFLRQVTWRAPQEGGGFMYDEFVLTFYKDNQKVLEIPVPRRPGQTSYSVPLAGYVAKPGERRPKTLLENESYTYRVTPWQTRPARQEVPEHLVSKSGLAADYQGAGHVNMVNERPTAPKIIAPAAGFIARSHQLAVEWEASSDPDPLDEVSYQVLIHRGGKQVKKVAAGRQTRTVISEALEDGDYVLEVVASDLDGLSASSARASFKVAVNLAPPAPRNLRPTPRPGVGGGAFLTWEQPPNVDGSRPQSAKVEVLDAAGHTAAQQELAGTQTSWEFKGGQYGQTYRFRVTAVNANGKRATSDLSLPFKFQGGLHAPLLPHPAPQRNALSMNESVSWQALPDVRTYVVSVDGRHDFNWSQASIPVKELLKNLPRRYNEQYVMKVAAVSPHDGTQSNWSVPFTFTLVKRIPTPPSQLRFVASRPGNDITEESGLAWTKAVDLEGETLRYQVQIVTGPDKGYALAETHETGLYFSSVWGMLRRLPEGPLQIRVVAVDILGQASQASNVLSLSWRPSLYDKMRGWGSPAMKPITPASPEETPEQAPPPGRRGAAGGQGRPSAGETPPATDPAGGQEMDYTPYSPRTAPGAAR